MKKIIPFLGLILLLFSGCYRDDLCYVSIKNTSFGNVGGTTATIYFTFEYTGSPYNSSPTITEYGVYLSDINTEPTSKDPIVKEQSDWERPSEVTLLLTGLKPSTTYYARSFARNAAGNLEGQVISFTTTGTVSVTTNNATSITSNSAHLNGNITVKGENVDLRQRGFVISTNSSPSLENYRSEWHEIGKTGAYSRNFTGFSSSTKYYFRAYAVVGSETIYGDVLSFTTNAPSGTYSLADFLGTYSFQGWNVSKGQYEYWDGVKISAASLKWSNGVIIEGIYEGSGHDYMHALGQYDASKNCIRLYSGWAYPSKTFYFTSDPNTYYYARFYPVYVDGTTIHEIYSGSGYDGCGEAFLTFTNSSTLQLGPADSPGTSDYYANGMRLSYYLSSDDSFQGYFPAYTNIWLNKTASGAPERKAPASEHSAMKTAASPNSASTTAEPTHRLGSDR